MSIYIEGIEMPQGENALLIGILPSGEVYSVFQDNETGELGLCKPKAEPVTAIPVPEHGRLIDADALRLKTQDYIEEYSNVDEHGFHSESWCSFKEAEMVINDAPTIIPASSKEGET